MPKVNQFELGPLIKAVGNLLQWALKEAPEDVQEDKWIKMTTHVNVTGDTFLMDQIHFGEPDEDQVERLKQREEEAQKFN